MDPLIWFLPTILPSSVKPFCFNYSPSGYSLVQGVISLALYFCPKKCGVERLKL